MATAGSRDKNPFSPGGNLGTTKYYLLVDTDGPNKGRITIKTPTLQGNISGPDGDRTIGFIPLDNSFQPSTTTNPEEIEYFSSAAGQKSVKNQGVITLEKSGIPQDQAKQLIFPNTAIPPTPPPPALPRDPEDNEVSQITGLGVINNVTPKNRGVLRYPLRIDENGQDYIKFRGIEYTPQAPGSSSYVLERPIQQKEDIKPIVTIILPIQPTIMDTNTVSWGEEKFGILEMIGSGISLDAMNGATVDKMVDQFTNTITSNGNLKSEIVAGIKASLAQKAIGSNNNLLSRLTGAVTNPNLTLLFNSPDLRNFSFNFKLSPRTKEEGIQVRKIIRSFKELMAVQRTAGNLFLEAPCVFEIEYIRGIDLINKEKDLVHPSLNRIKTCALRSFSVNYTPSGSYMAYNDKEGTMTSYDLTMAFTELDPIYFDDYADPETGNDKIPFDQIGY